MAHHSYPSDLTDAEWALLEPLLPLANPIGSPRIVQIRESSMPCCPWRTTAFSGEHYPRTFRLGKRSMAVSSTGVRRDFGSR